MARFTMESGLSVSLKVMELKHGLMEDDTKVNGSKANQSEKELKLIKMDQPKEASGKAEYLLFLVMSQKVKMLTF